MGPGGPREANLALGEVGPGEPEFPKVEFDAVLEETSMLAHISWTYHAVCPGLNGVTVKGVTVVLA